MKLQTPKDYTEPKDMTKRQLKDWIEWTTEEVSEYQEFINVLTKELKKRK